MKFFKDVVLNPGRECNITIANIICCGKQDSL